MHECKHNRAERRTFIATSYGDIYDIHTEYSDKICKRCGKLISRKMTKRNSFVTPSRWGKLVYGACNSLNELNLDLYRSIDILNGEKFRFEDARTVKKNSAKF